MPRGIILLIFSLLSLWQKSAPRDRRPVVYSHALFTLVITFLSQGHLVLQHHFRVREQCGTAHNLTCAEQTCNWGTAVISLSTICWGRTSAPVHGLCGPSLAVDEKNSSCKYFPQTPFGQAQNVWNLPISLPSFSLSLRLQNYPKPVKSSTMEHFSSTHTLHTSSPGDMRGTKLLGHQQTSFKEGLQADRLLSFTLLNLMCFNHVFY